MNRKERRANKKNKNGNGNGAAHVNGTPQGAPQEGMTVHRTPEGKTRLSIPVPEAARHQIKDKEQYLKDFERAQKLILEEEELIESTQILNKLLKQNPQDHGVYELLGLASEKLKNYDAAIKFFRAAKQLQPEKYSLDIAVGNLLIKIDKINEGLHLLEQSIENHSDKVSNIDLAGAYGSAGNAYMFLNDAEKAKTALRKACELAPQNLEYLYNYVTQVGKPKSKDDPFFQKLLELEKINDNTRTDQENGLLYYALFDCYDAIKEHEKAFDYAMKGAVFKRKSIDITSEKIDLLYSGIKEYFTKDFFEDCKEPGYETETPVFILGMPRSGTTLLEQILQAHPDISGVGEDALIGHLIRHYSMMDKYKDAFYPLRTTRQIDGYFTTDVVGRKYDEYLTQKLPDAKRVINKAIGNILFVGYLHIALPQARFIHIKRNAMDSCLSSFTKNFIDNAQGYSYDLNNLGTYYRHYTELMDHWNEVLPGLILNVNYEDIVDDLEGNARKLIDHLDLPWDDRCLEFHTTENVVRTASISQVRKPIYKSSVGRWKRYGQKVIPLIEALGPAAPPEAIDFLKENGITPEFAD